MKAYWILLAILAALLAAFLLAAPVQAQDGTTTTPTPLQNARGYAVGWGALSLINAGIAQGKNRSGLNWWLLSIPLGPIATLLLVAFFKKLPQPGT